MGIIISVNNALVDSKCLNILQFQLGQLVEGHKDHTVIKTLVQETTTIEMQPTRSQFTIKIQSGPSESNQKDYNMATLIPAQEPMKAQERTELLRATWEKKPMIQTT